MDKLFFNFNLWNGKVAIEFVSPPSNVDQQKHLSLSFLEEDIILDFDVRSLLGHRTKIKDLPKFTSMITHKLKKVFIDEIVYPNCKTWKLPFLWQDAREEKNMQEELEELVEEIKAA